MSDNSAIKILENPDGQINSIQEPAEPSHLVRQPCPKGYMAWDENKIVYSIDHRAHLVFCKKCDGYHVKPAGAPVMMTTPTAAADELMENAKSSKGKKK